MAMTNYNDRDLNAFLMKQSATGPNLGPGAYQPVSDFPELKKRTRSRKPPAFNDGIAPGKETVAIGSNYFNQTYNPAPGRYNNAEVGSPFATEIIKNKDQDQFFTIKNG
jgi:hypothetical protein